MAFETEFVLVICSRLDLWLADTAEKEFLFQCFRDIFAALLLPAAMQGLLLPAIGWPRAFAVIFA